MVTAPDHGYVVGTITYLRKQVRNQETGLSTRSELPRAASQHGLSGIVNETGFDRLGQFHGKGLSTVFRQLRLGVESVHMAGTTMHEQVDDALRFGRKIRGAGHQRRGRRSL